MKLSRGLMSWMIIIGLLIMLFVVLNNSKSGTEIKTWDEFVTYIDPAVGTINEDNIVQVKSDRVQAQLREGAAGDAMFFISSGTVSVQLPDGAVRLGPGDFFGEMALLSDAPRVADVMAEGYVRLLVLNRSGFEVLGEAAPMLARSVANAALARAAAQAG